MINAYFRQLASDNRHFETLKATTEAVGNVSSSIKTGKVRISPNPQELSILSKQLSPEQQIKVKIDKLENELETVAHQQSLQSQRYHALKKQLINLKKQQAQLLKSEQQQKKRISLQRTKKWKDQQRKIEGRKLVAEQKHHQRQLQSEEKIKKEQEDLRAFSKLQKQKIIEGKIRKIHQQHDRRQQIIRNGNQLLLSQGSPKYLQIQKTYERKLYQMKFQEQISKRNRKLEMKLDTEAIKAHQKAFLQRVKGRDAKLHTSARKAEEKQDIRIKFKILYNRDEQKLKQELQKLERRRKFQSKIKEIPIQIDQSKKVEIQIARDKAKNPFKYNFLSQKALNDMQIYGQFKQFQMNSDSRELGKEYLKELRSLPKSNQISKSSSLHTIQQSTHEKPMYKNYLEQLKSSRKVQSQDQIDDLLHSNKSKNRIRDILEKRSQSLQAEAIRKMRQMKKVQNYKQSLKKSSEVDSDYMKAIKAKIACLQVQTE